MIIISNVKIMLKLNNPYKTIWVMYTKVYMFTQHDKNL